MKIMKRKPNPVMVAVVGFICLSYLVKHTNGDPFAAGRQTPPMEGEPCIDSH